MANKIPEIRQHVIYLIEMLVMNRYKNNYFFCTIFKTDDELQLLIIFNVGKYIYISYLDKYTLKS